MKPTKNSHRCTPNRTFATDIFAWPRRGWTELQSAWNLRRLSAWRIEGREIHSNLPIRIDCVGNLHQSRFLIEAALGKDYHRESRRQLTVQQLGRFTRAKDNACDLLIVSIPAWLGRLSSLRYDYAIPAWLGGEISLQILQNKIVKESLRSDIRRVRRHQLETIIADDQATFDQFYFEMYLPMTQQAHGNSAIIRNYDQAKSLFHANELLLIRKDGTNIAGTIIDYSKPHPSVSMTGVREPIHLHQKWGAFAAIYYYSATHLLCKGFKRMGVGWTRPLLYDGVMNYKRKWNIEITDSCGPWSHLKCSTHRPVVNSFLTQHPFIHGRRGQLEGIAFTSSNKEVLEHQLKSKYHLAGLKRFALHRKPPQQTTTEDSIEESNRSNETNVSPEINEQSE